MEWITPEEDFPSPDGNPPLKTLLLRVSPTNATARWRFA
jgi:hypothetical protein